MPAAPTPARGGALQQPPPPPEPCTLPLRLPPGPGQAAEPPTLGEEPPPRGRGPAPCSAARPPHPLWRGVPEFRGDPAP